MKKQDKNKFIDQYGAYYWDELLEYSNEHLGDLKYTDASIIVFVTKTMKDAISCVVYAYEYGLDFGILGEEKASRELLENLDSKSIKVIKFGEEGPSKRKLLSEKVFESGSGKILVFTSGTTGIPKPVVHSWLTLNTLSKVSQQVENTWFLLYQSGSYAWYQMLCLGMFVKDQNIFCAEIDNLSQSFENALKQEVVSAISSTPTFWRYVFMTVSEEVISNSSLSLISLGGEIVDQHILDKLSSTYPHASIKHIYASSEAGVAIVVSDKKAGFDASLVGDAEKDVKIKVADGRLFVSSRYQAQSDEQVVWLDTGDLVEKRAGRFFFCGRSDNNMINVGGQKAYPADIEAVLSRHPAVSWVKVSSKKAPLVGYLPKASLVLSKEYILVDDVERQLSLYCHENMPDYAVPKLWAFLSEIPISASLKS